MKVLIVSNVGSQNKPFRFNVPFSKGASCGATHKPGLKFRFTHPYSNFPILLLPSPPRIPPVLRQCPAQEPARTLRRSPGHVGRAVSSGIADSQSGALPGRARPCCPSDIIVVHD